MTDELEALRDRQEKLEVLRQIQKERAELDRREHEALIAAYDAEAGTADIGEVLGLTPEAAGNRLKKLGIKLRPRGSRKRRW